MIFPDFVWGRDGAMAAAQILHLMAREGKPLSELLKNCLYYQVKTRLEIDLTKGENSTRSRENNS